MDERSTRISKHLANRLVLLKKKPTKKEWMEMVKKAETVVDNLTQSHIVSPLSPADEIPHRAYTDAMSRKAHRYALLKTAQSVGEIDWGFTENDWTVLKAGDTGETMLVSVRMAIPKSEYERQRRQYERMMKARAAKAKKGGKAK
jgi:hypothetical protein